MVLLQIATFIMIALLLISMMAKARPWAKAPLPGKPLQTIPLGFLPRLLTYRSSLLALLSGCTLAFLAGWLPLNLVAMVAAFALIILLIPMRYTLTTQGVAVGDGIFHPWSDFSGFKAGKSSLQLAAPTNFVRLTLFVKSAEMDDVLKHVQRHVKSKSSNLSFEGE
jgi:hypothetical protein